MRCSGAGAEIPLKPMVKTVVRQAVPLQTIEVHGGADIHLQPMEDPTPEQVDDPEGGLEPVMEQVPDRTCDHVGD